MKHYPTKSEFINLYGQETLDKALELNLFRIEDDQVILN